MEMNLITKIANRYKGREVVELVCYLKVLTNISSPSSSFMHIKIQYGCPKGTFGCNLSVRFCCNVHKEKEIEL